MCLVAKTATKRYVWGDDVTFYIRLSRNVIGRDGHLDQSHV